MSSSAPDLYSRLLKRDDWRQDMTKVEHCHHTFNVEWDGYSSAPGISELRWSLADASPWTGPLQNMPAVFLCATRNLQDESPYPLDGCPGQRYWRVKICLVDIFLDFFPDGYNLFYCRNPHRQTSGPWGRDVYQVNIVVASESESRYLEGDPDLLKLDPAEENPFLYMADGEWMTNSYWQLVPRADPVKYTVNLVLLKDFRFTTNAGVLLPGVEWQPVAKVYDTSKQTMPVEPRDNSDLSRDELAKRALREWSNAWRVKYGLDLLESEDGEDVEDLSQRLSQASSNE